MADGDRSLAIFIDFENLALGFQGQGRNERFDISRVLERLVEKGKIVAKKAYADWNRFAQFTHKLHEAAIELIEIPKRGQTGKNSADIRLCVDAMDLAYSKEHINTFAIISGDSDFSPLVSKLKELGKHVIGLGMQDSTSDLLRDNCDEFIYYEDLGQGQPTLTPAITSHLSDQKRKGLSLLMESLIALRRENKEVLWSSMIKDTIKRKKPSFNETYHGYRTFSEMLEDAQREGLLELETDKRSRTYVVTRFGSEMHDESRQSTLPETLPGTTVPGIAAVPAAIPVSLTEQAAVLVGPGVSSMPSAPILPGTVMGPDGVIKRKSRRRRRRGSGNGGVPNGNGAGVQPGPVPEFQPVVIPPGPAPAIAVVPNYSPLREMVDEPVVPATPIRVPVVSPRSAPIAASAAAPKPLPIQEPVVQRRASESSTVFGAGVWESTEDLLAPTSVPATPAPAPEPVQEVIPKPAEETEVAPAKATKSRTRSRSTTPKAAGTTTRRTRKPAEKGEASSSKSRSTPKEAT